MISVIPHKINECDLYLILWVIYYLQGIVYPEGGVISISILAILLLLSLYHTKDVLTQDDNPTFFYGLTLLLLMFTIYGIILIIVYPGGFKYGSHRSQESYFYLKQIYLSLLPIYSFYYYTKSGKLTAERLRNWIYIFVISAFISFFRNKIESQSRFGLEETTNNMSYLFVALTPSLLLFKKKTLIQYCGMLMILIFIIAGMKRGAILIGILSIFFLLRDSIHKESLNKKVILFGLSLFVVALGVYYFEYQMASSEYFVSRIEQTRMGNSSDRDILYTQLWIIFTNKSDIFNFILGHGAYGTLKTIGSFAHNDWLEIAINQGALGIAVFIYFFWTFFKSWKDAETSEAKAALALVGFIIFARSLISMSYEDLTFMISSVLGYYLANPISKEQYYLLYEEDIDSNKIIH